MTETDREKAPLLAALHEFTKRRPVYFCIPGHRFNRGIPKALTDACGGDIANFDLTEAPGLDDLHNAGGAIRDAQILLAEAFGAQESRFLVNGTTCGIEAAIMASCRPGDRILLPRNAHRSVIGGLIMSGAVPVWMQPEYDPSFGFASAVTPETVRQKLKEVPGIKAVLIVSPTYYGTISDIAGIAAICHEAFIPLIVDEAHGAHLYFSGNNDAGAIRQGADLSVMSAHKTLFSFGQSSFLHIKSEYLSAARVDAALKLLMTSSPSYMLMASLDAARLEAVENGRASYEKACALSAEIRKCAKQLGFSVFHDADDTAFREGYADPARVVLSAEALGLSGPAFQELLFDRFGIAVEMSDPRNIVLVVTAANTEEETDAFCKALAAIREDYDSGIRNQEQTGSQIPQNGFYSAGEILKHLPGQNMTPRDAFFAPHIRTDIRHAEDRTAGESIVVYPPGQAILYPGEQVDRTVLSVIEQCKEHGLTLQTDSGHDLTQICLIQE